MENKKKFEKPELEVIEFTNDDIITESGGLGETGWQQGDINGKPNGWW